MRPRYVVFGQQLVACLSFYVLISLSCVSNVFPSLAEQTNQKIMLIHLSGFWCSIIPILLQSVAACTTTMSQTVARSSPRAVVRSVPVDWFPLTPVDARSRVLWSPVCCTSLLCCCCCAGCGDVSCHRRRADRARAVTDWSTLIAVIAPVSDAANW